MKKSENITIFHKSSFRELFYKKSVLTGEVQVSTKKEQTKGFNS